MLLERASMDFGFLSLDRLCRSGRLPKTWRRKYSCRPWVSHANTLGRVKKSLQEVKQRLLIGQNMYVYDVFK